MPLVSDENPKLTREARGPPYEPLVCPSPFFMYYIFEALKTTGYRLEVVDCIRRWYSVFLDWGFSTTGENWIHRKGATSACHAWSAHPIVHLSNIVLGITQAAPGWEKITFEPLLADGAHARGSVATPLGLVETNWERGKDGINVKLSLPKGVKANVRLPGVRKDITGGRHEWRLP